MYRTGKTDGKYVELGMGGSSMIYCKLVITQEVLKVMVQRNTFFYLILNQFSFSEEVLVSPEHIKWVTDPGFSHFSLQISSDTQY